MKDMNEQIKALVEDYRKVRVPTVVMAQTGTFALIEALKNSETLARIEAALQGETALESGEPTVVEVKIDELLTKFVELSTKDTPLETKIDELATQNAALTTKVDELSKTVGEIALALAKATAPPKPVAPAPAPPTGQNTAGGGRR
jgi:outer membrane murein-binding lipoprotein Lpp